MADFVELGAEGVNWVTEKYFDKGYDAVGNQFAKRKNKKGNNQNQDQQAAAAGGTGAAGADNAGAAGATYPAASAVSGKSKGSQKSRKHRNRLPSPEGNHEERSKENYRDSDRRRARDRSLDRESEFSEQVIKDYQRDRRDPPRKPESVLSQKDLKTLRRDSKMSYANGYGSNRPHSAQPPRTRGHDYDDEYGSDYDERSGRRYKTTGRGYEDDDRYDDRPYDREIIETERYRGVSKPLIIRPHN